MQLMALVVLLDRVSRGTRVPIYDAIPCVAEADFYRACLSIIAWAPVEKVPLEQHQDTTRGGSGCCTPDYHSSSRRPR